MVEGSSSFGWVADGGAIVAAFVGGMGGGDGCW